MPQAWSSVSSSRPRPTASSRRPPDRKSRVASSLARTVGFLSGRASTLVPNFILRVRAATHERATTGSRLRASDTTRSLSHSESMARDSARSTALQNASGLVSPKGQPLKPMPMPILMGSLFSFTRWRGASAGGFETRPYGRYAWPAARNPPDTGGDNGHYQMRPRVFHHTAYAVQVAVALPRSSGRFSAHGIDGWGQGHY